MINFKINTLVQDGGHDKGEVHYVNKQSADHGEPADPTPSRYTIIIHFKHFVMNEKHSKYFSVCIICIMQVCTHFSSNYFVF